MGFRIYENKGRAGFIAIIGSDVYAISNAMSEYMCAASQLVHEPTGERVHYSDMPFSVKLAISERIAEATNQRDNTGE